MQEYFFDGSDRYRAPETDEDGRVVLSVEECHALINEAVSRLGRMKVRGEISQPRVRGQMAFFDLKDANGKEYVLHCALFGWQFRKFQHLLREGMEVTASGKPNLYKKGALSMVLDEIEPYGEGAWKRALEELKKKLAAKEYFLEERKRIIPPFVQKVGLITSEGGDAIKDFRQNIGEYGFQIYFYGVWVEGEKAERSIVRALQWMNANHPDMDVLVLVRGGGSMENLKAYNSERVADAIAASRIPVLTGIGHENDETIAGLVSDKNCSTPTAAASFLRGQREDLIRGVAVRQEALIMRAEALVAEKERILRDVCKTLMISVERVLERYRFSLAKSAERLHQRFSAIFSEFHKVERRFLHALYLFERGIEDRKYRLAAAESILASLNPENILQRGYSIARNAKGEIVKSQTQVAADEEVMVRLSQGGFSSRVTRKFQR